MERILRTRVLTGLVLAVVFGAGVLLGLALDRSLAAQPVAEVAEADDARQSDGQEHRHPLWEQVSPTAEQKVLIDSIVGEYRSAMRSLHAEFRAAYNPRYESLVSDTRRGIKGVLTSGQAVKYDSLVADYEQRRRAERSRNEQED